MVLRRIQALEKGIGSPLFDRLSTGYVATEAGRTLTDAGQAINTAITNASRVIEGRSAELSGVVSFTTTDSLAHVISPLLLASFRPEHPAIRVESLITNNLVDLDVRAADVTLRPTSRPPELWVGMRLVRMDFGIYAFPAYVAGRPKMAWNDFDWVFPNGQLDGAPATRWIKTLVSPDRVVSKIDSFVAMAALARAGVGATVLPWFLGSSMPDLTLITPASDKASVDVWILTHPNLKNAGRIAAFVDHVSAGVREQKMLFEASRRTGRTK